MTKTYSVLQKKLEELESILSETIYRPTDQPHHLQQSDDIEQRFVFLNNLLSAEIASHPKKPQHLHHISRRLTDLDTAWSNFKTTASIDNLDAASSCSCTESCFNDDGEALVGTEEWDHVYDGLEVLSEALIDEKVKAETIGDASETVRVRKMDLGVMASGMAVGAVLMGFFMVRFFGCYYFVDYADFLTPT